MHPSSIYTVINGRKSVLDLTATSALTPRMIRILAGVGSDNIRPSMCTSQAASNNDNVPRSKKNMRKSLDEERTYERLAEKVPGTAH